MQKYEIVKIDEVDVAIDFSMYKKTEELYFCATDVAKHFNVNPYEWIRSQSTERYIKALVKKYPNLDSKYGKSPLLKTVKGRYGGSYFHKKLFLLFAQWLSPEFAVECNDWIESFFREEHFRKSAILEAKTGYRPLTDAIQESHDPIKHYHFSNENDLLNRIIKGRSSKQLKEEYQIDNVQDCYNAREMHALSNLRRINTVLIQISHSYEERKAQLIKSYNEKFSQRACDNYKVPEIEEQKEE